MALPDHAHGGGREADLTVRPVLTSVGDALAKAGRFADLSEQTADDSFETVIHGAYFAMFHAARAALMAVEGGATTDHAGVVARFARMSTKMDLRSAARNLAKGCNLHARAHHGAEDLTEQEQALRARMRPFLALCAGLVEERAKG